MSIVAYDDAGELTSLGKEAMYSKNVNTHANDRPTNG